MITATESKPARLQEAGPPAPRVRTRGHLVLMDWEGVGPAAPHSPGPRLADAIRRSRTQRLYQRGVVALMVLSGLAAAFGLGGH